MQILKGHTSHETAYVVDDYPYGFHMQILKAALQGAHSLERNQMTIDQKLDQLAKDMHRMLFEDMSNLTEDQATLFKLAYKTVKTIIRKRKTVWYTIKTLDGRTLSRTHDLSDKWDWIVRTVLHSTNCDFEEEVDVIETEDGDIITVRGEHYAQISREIV